MSGDRGVTLALVAVMVTALVLVSALAIDGGRAYANRRQMQNAADLASLSGTRYWAKHRFDAAPPTMTDLVKVIKDQAGDNLSDLSNEQLDCWMVDNGLDPQPLPTTSPIDICDNPSAASWSQFVGSAAGVWVNAARNQETFLASVGGFDILNARAAATSTMQPLVGLLGRSPFIVCGVTEPGAPNDLLRGEDINPASIGNWVAIQGSDGSDLLDCEAGASFDGKAANGWASVPGWMEGDNGNGLDQEILRQVVGSNPSCLTGSVNQATANGCLVVLPLATEGEGNNPSRLWIVNFGVFKVYGDGNNSHQECRTRFSGATPKYCGEFLGRAEISNGAGGSGPVGQNQPYIVKLVK